MTSQSRHPQPSVPEAPRQSWLGLLATGCRACLTLHPSYHTLQKPEGREHLRRLLNWEEFDELRDSRRSILLDTLYESIIFAVGKGFPWGEVAQVVKFTEELLKETKVLDGKWDIYTPPQSLPTTSLLMVKGKRISRRHRLSCHPMGCKRNSQHPSVMVLAESQSLTSSKKTSNQGTTQNPSPVSFKTQRS
ncbi:hypothetical protein FD754_023544 [Muntiacus muntjak]|uniref:Uncharacterized protein n=1 Tax=Muntiacus muntjak TaxID=9888 RepID=A0A5N3UTA4_MUNMU|nr:hypothetical protein FD754_023544 [Muntiacus muntjak]